MTDKCCGNCPWSFKENLGGPIALVCKNPNSVHFNNCVWLHSYCGSYCGIAGNKLKEDT